MIISFEIGGPTAKTLAQIRRQSDDVKRTIRDTFFFMGRQLKKEISADIKDTSTKTGRVYLLRDRRGGRIRHKASAPFETHADLTGTLRRSLGWKVQGINNLLIGYGVSSRPAPDYADIEFGTDKILPRPSIANHVEDARFETFFHQRLEQLASK
jgi:hypothetical protein